MRKCFASVFLFCASGASLVAAHRAPLAPQESVNYVSRSFFWVALAVVVVVLLVVIAKLLPKQKD